MLLFIKRIYRHKVYKKVMIYLKYLQLFQRTCNCFYLPLFPIPKTSHREKNKNKFRPENDINYLEGIVSLSLLRLLLLSIHFANQGFYSWPGTE